MFSFFVTTSGAAFSFSPWKMSLVSSSPYWKSFSWLFCSQVACCTRVWTPWTLCLCPPARRVPAPSFRTPVLTRTQTRICYQDPYPQSPAARSRAPSLMSCKVDFVYLTIVRLAWLMLSLVLSAWPLQNWLLLAELQLPTTGLSFLPCSCYGAGISLWYWCFGWCTRFSILDILPYKNMLNPGRRQALYLVRAFSGALL